MLITFLIWLYICIHAFIWGDFFSAQIAHLADDKDNQPKNFYLTLFVGITFLAIFAQLFHFMHRFNYVAQLILMILSATFLLIRLKKIKLNIKYFWYDFRKESVAFWVGAVMLVVPMLGLTSDSPSFYDTDLYHAQTVKWAEQYRVVIGLGNLYSAFGLNSSVFTLEALFSLVFVFGQSMHAVSGLVVIWLMLYCHQQSFGYVATQRPLSVFRIFTFFCLFFLIFCPFFTEFAASLFPDIIANIFGFLSLLMVIAETEKSKASPTVLFYILLFAVFAVSAKLSMIFFIVVPLLSIRFYCKSRRNFFLAFGISAIILIPYLAKTVLLSGYLLYPFYWLDVFQVDWKMPRAAIFEEMMWIRSWNRVPMEKFEVVMRYPLFHWMPIWFSKLRTQDLVLLSMLPLSLLLGVGQLLIVKTKIFVAIHKPYIWLYVVCLLGTIIWFLGSPDPRFGYAFFISLTLLLLSVVLQKPLSWLAKHVLKTKTIFNAQNLRIVGCVMIFVLFFSPKAYTDKFETVRDKLLIFPADYPEYRMLQDTANEVVFYRAALGDRMGYKAPLPSSPYRNKRLQMRGDRIVDGYRSMP